MAARRVVQLSLPASDPRSAVITAWIEALPGDSDVARELRRVIADALALQGRLSAIEGKLDRLLAGGGAPAGAPPAAALAVSPEEEAALEALFDFG